MLLSLADVSVNFPGPHGFLQAVRGLCLDVPEGAITCLAGESGCGKSLTCRAILRLLPEHAVTGGHILFQGRDILTLSESDMRHICGASIGMIFQEPMTSLNPVMTVGAQAAEPLRLHLGQGQKEARAKVIELFGQVGIPEAEKRYSAYPHQLSGGMRQRVMIAMALSCSPDLLLADEPTTALDATIQGQILESIKQESRQRGMAVLLITHDLGIAADLADYAGIMYAGMLMEHAAACELFANPLHPYTRGLIAAQPGRASMGAARLNTIPGYVPSLAQIPQGCPFQPRCAEAMPQCSIDVPPDKNLRGHQVRCWLYQ